MTIEKQGLKRLKERYKEKYVSGEALFSRINRGDAIFIGTGCGEPQQLLRKLVEYVRKNPKAVLDSEVYQLWDIGSFPYTEKEFQDNFRHNSFFIGRSIREAVNKGLADYTPMSLSDVPRLFHAGILPVNVALIQTSYPDKKGYVSLGVSVDIVREAVDEADLVIAQMNSRMPYVRGDGLIHINDLDYILPYDEPLLEYRSEADEKIADAIGRNVARLIKDGDTIQLGYGGLLSSVPKNLAKKKHLGIHTELLSDGLIELMKNGAVDNSKKSLDKKKSVASFCMGTKKGFEYIDDNPAVLFRDISYTDNPLIIAMHDNMAAINSALAIDLSGQATEESVGKRFYGGIGGQASFMRGASLSKNGKPILVLESTAENGKTSRIMPFLPQGAGVTLNRGDVHYVVTEYGVAYLHGKNVRERAMELISIAHPKFRPTLIEEAKKHNLIYQDQAYVAGKGGEYPKQYEAYRKTYKGLGLFIRPVKITDEELLKEFFYSVSEDSMYSRFMSPKTGMPHDKMQEYTVIDYGKQMVLLAFAEKKVAGIAQYDIDESTHTADIAFLVRDDFQHMGVATELFRHLIHIAKKKGILGFSAEVLTGNEAMIEVFEESGLAMEKRRAGDVYEIRMTF